MDMSQLSFQATQTYDKSMRQSQDIDEFLTTPREYAPVVDTPLFNQVVSPMKKKRGRFYSTNGDSNHNMNSSSSGRLGLSSSQNIPGEFRLLLPIDKREDTNDGGPSYLFGLSQDNDAQGFSQDFTDRFGQQLSVKCNDDSQAGSFTGIGGGGDNSNQNSFVINTNLNNNHNSSHHHHNNNSSNSILNNTTNNHKHKNHSNNNIESKELTNDVLTSGDGFQIPYVPFSKHRNTTNGNNNNSNSNGVNNSNQSTINGRNMSTTDPRILNKENAPKNSSHNIHSHTHNPSNTHLNLGNIQSNNNTSTAINNNNNNNAAGTNNNNNISSIHSHNAANTASHNASASAAVTSDSERQITLPPPIINPFLSHSHPHDKRHSSDGGKITTKNPHQHATNIWITAFKERPRYITDFHQEGILGQGTSSNVYSARRRLDGVLYAIKILKTQIYSEGESKIITKEVCAHAALQGCPHVVQYFGCWIDDGYLHIQTELCALGNLDCFISNVRHSTGHQHHMITNNNNATTNNNNTTTTNINKQNNILLAATAVVDNPSSSSSSSLSAFKTLKPSGSLSSLYRSDSYDVIEQQEQLEREQREKQQQQQQQQLQSLFGSANVSGTLSFNVSGNNSASNSTKIFNTDSNNSDIMNVSNRNSAKNNITTTNSIDSSDNFNSNSNIDSNINNDNNITTNNDDDEVDHFRMSTSPVPFNITGSDSNIMGNSNNGSGGSGSLTAAALVSEFGSGYNISSCGKSSSNNNYKNNAAISSSSIGKKDDNNKSTITTNKTVSSLASSTTAVPAVAYSSSKPTTTATAATENVYDMIELAVWVVLSRIGAAVHYMHERGMAHLDIRPANMFLASNTCYNSYSSTSTNSSGANCRSASTSNKGSSASGVTTTANNSSNNNNTAAAADTNASHSHHTTSGAVNGLLGGGTNKHSATAAAVSHTPLELAAMLVHNECLVKLGDFGLVCKLDHQGEIEEGESRYCAWEVINGNGVIDLRSADIFSLGASVYELSLGRRLGAGGDDGSAEWHNIRHGILDNSLLRGGRYSVALIDIISRMVHPEPTQRPTACDITCIADKFLANYNNNNKSNNIINNHCRFNDNNNKDSFNVNSSLVLLLNPSIKLL